MADPAGDVEAENVLITGGGQGSLALLFRALAAPGAPVLVESPTYPGALAAARAAGLRPVAVPMDADGMRPDLLADVFAMTGARVLYCQPSLHNPTGTVLAAHRRAQTIAVARAAGAFLIEDDFGRHLGHGRPLPRPLLTEDVDGTVVYLTSLTKPTAPSLRIGAVIARGPVMRRLQTLRFVEDFFTARPLQEAAIEMRSTPAWDRHLRTLATALRDRCATLSATVATELPAWRAAGCPAAGLHLWLELPDGPAADAAAPCPPQPTAPSRNRRWPAQRTDETEPLEDHLIFCVRPGQPGLRSASTPSRSAPTPSRSTSTSARTTSSCEHAGPERRFALLIGRWNYAPGRSLTSDLRRTRANPGQSGTAGPA